MIRKDPSMSEAIHTPEHLSEAPLLRDLLVQSATTFPRSINPAIESIRLMDSNGAYDLRKAVEEPLRAKAYEGTTPSNLQWFIDVLVTLQNTLYVNRTPRPADERWAVVDMQAALGLTVTERHTTQERLVGAIAHTYPCELPLSSIDLATLFYASGEPQAAVASWTLTESSSWIAFRGPRTPQWSSSEAIRKAFGWSDMIYKRITGYIQKLDYPASDEERLTIEQRARVAFLQQAAAKYDLQIFHGPKYADSLQKLDPWVK
jgi:hypothetical protein